MLKSKVNKCNVTGKQCVCRQQCSHLNWIMDHQRKQHQAHLFLIECCDGWKWREADKTTFMNNQQPSRSLTVHRWWNMAGGEEPRKPKSFCYLLEQCSVWAMNKWINHNELLQRCQWPPPLGTIHLSLELTGVCAQKNGWAGLYWRALACEASEEGTQSYIKNGVCDISIIFFSFLGRRLG